MKVSIRSDSVEIEGYVNAIEYFTCNWFVHNW